MLMPFSVRVTVALCIPSSWAISVSLSPFSKRFFSRISILYIVFPPHVVLASIARVYLLEIASSETSLTGFTDIGCKLKIPAVPPWRDGEYAHARIQAAFIRKHFQPFFFPALSAPFPEAPAVRFCGAMLHRGPPARL